MITIVFTRINILVIFSKFRFYLEDLVRLYTEKMISLSMFFQKNTSLSSHKMQHIWKNPDRHQFFYRNNPSQAKAIPIASTT